LRSTWQVSTQPMRRAALQRARAIMVETATFGLVTDAHDGRQRSTQEIAVATFTDDIEAGYMCGCGTATSALRRRPIGGRVVSSLSGGVNDLQTSLHVVGDGGEADLHGGLGKPAPAHASKTIASLPGAEDLLDPATDAMDRLVPGIETCQGFGFVAPPHGGSDDARSAAFGAHRIAEMVSPICTSSSAQRI